MRADAYLDVTRRELDVATISTTRSNRCHQTPLESTVNIPPSALLTSDLRNSEESAQEVLQWPQRPVWQRADPDSVDGEPTDRVRPSRSTGLRPREHDR